MYIIAHLMLSFKIPIVKSFKSFVFIILLDYILPYVFIGMSSLFRFKIFRDKFHKVCSGIWISFMLSTLCSVISGVIFWSDYIPCGINIWLYSVIYNSIHKLPQLIITIHILRYIFDFVPFTTFL